MTGGEAGEATRSGDGSKGSSFLYKWGEYSIIISFRGKIINNYWTRLSKISLFVRGEQINYLPKPKAVRQIIDLRDTTNHDILRQPSSIIIVLSFDHRVCFFNEYPWEARWSSIFTRERSQEGEKHCFLYAWAEYYLQPNTVGWHCTWADHYL